MEPSGGNQSVIFAGVGIIVLLFILAISLAFYVFYSYCFMRICKKTGHEPGALVWIPIVQLIPLLQVAGWPAWYLILMFVPLVNIVVSVWMWVKICEARSKSGWMVLMLFVPVVNLAFIPYLAFSE